MARCWRGGCRRRPSGTRTPCCALKQAVKWNLIPRNPAELVELPKVTRKERRVLSSEEARRFIVACDEMPHGVTFEFALLTGMRPEEYYAVQWGDVDFERCTVAGQARAGPAQEEVELRGAEDLAQPQDGGVARIPCRQAPRRTRRKL